MLTSQDFKVTVSARREHLEQTRELVHFVSKQNGLNDSEADVMEMAVSEACLNSWRHGSTDKERAKCRLELFIDGETITAVVTDGGRPFDFDAIEPFDIHQDFLKYQNGGLGIPLMKALMDEVRYERKSNHTNEITLVKYLKEGTKKGGTVRHENKGKH